MGTPPAAVSVSMEDLKHGTVSLETLEEAFGPNSLGIIIVRDLPPEYVQLRSQLLSLSSYLANLPEEELGLSSTFDRATMLPLTATSVKLERADAGYDVGWSCGKETLANGRYDTLKGSYYAQPVYNAALEKKAKELFPDFPEMTSPNVWPEDSVLPGFEKIFESLCYLIIDVAGYVARSCDRYGVTKLEGYKEGVLEAIVRSSVSTKARLLHYFPPPPAAAKDEVQDSDVLDDGWCATHHDLGALTGLTSQMFVDEAVHIPKPQVAADGTLTFPPLTELGVHPDPRTGLWIKDRAGRMTQVNIPADCLAFQTGEALQLITQGRFRAVPHFVRGAKAGKAGSIARNTLAVFTQPNLWEKVDEKRTFADLARSTISAAL